MVKYFIYFLTQRFYWYYLIPGGKEGINKLIG